MRPIVRTLSSVLLAPLLALPVSPASIASATDLGPDTSAATSSPATSSSSAAGSSSAAPTDGAQAGAPPTTPHLPALSTTGRIPLSLEEAIALGLRKNLAVEISRFEPAVAREKVGEAWGAFDPLLQSNLAYRATETPNANVILDILQLREKETFGDARLSGLIPFWGATYDIGYAGSRLLTNSGVAALSPELSSSLVGTVSLPLLRDFLADNATTQLRVSRLGVDVSDDNFRTALMDVVQAIESTYWTVIASEQQRRVAEKSVETATKLLEQVKTQYEVGVVSKVDVVEAEAGVYERQYDLIVARTAYRQAQDDLIDLVYGQDFRATDTVEIDPTDRPEGDVIYETNMDVIMEHANARRPELAAAQKNVQVRDVQLGYAKNQRLPQLDVVGTYGYSGLVGSPKSTIFGSGSVPSEFISRRFWDTNQNYFSSEGANQWSTQGVFSIPILNEAARKRVTQGALELRRAKTDALRVEQRIVLEVRRAVRNLESAKEGIQAAESRQRASAEQLRAETIRQEQGESTPFDVLLRERDLVQAEAQRIEAQRIYRTSATNLDRAQGTILESHRIEVENQRLLR